MFGKIKSIFKAILELVIYFVIMAFVSLFIYNINNKGESLVEKIKGKSQMSDALTNNIIQITIVASIVTLVIFYLLFRLKDQDLIKRCNFRKLNNKEIKNIFSLALLISFANMFLTMALSPYFLEYQEVSKMISNQTTSIFGILTLVVLVPIFEEILFRGIIFNTLKKEFKLISSVFISALIFSVAHGNMLQGIYTFILGVLLASTYNKLNSIIAPILIHLIYNFLGSLIAIFIPNLGIINIPMFVLFIVLTYRMYQKIEYVEA
ncbi:type II CAAX endopeptidase family protein [Peptostreptococcaceae bacterium AGR-M142]